MASDPNEHRRLETLEARIDNLRIVLIGLACVAFLGLLIIAALAR